VALADTRGQDARHLDPNQVRAVLAHDQELNDVQGSPFSSALGRRVSKSTTGSGARAHRNAIAEVSIGNLIMTSLS